MRARPGSVVQGMRFVAGVIQAVPATVGIREQVLHGCCAAASSYPEVFDMKLNRQGE